MLNFSGNFTTNPYFDPDVSQLLLVLRITCGVSIFLNVFATYLILYKSPPQKSKWFCRMMIYHLWMGMAAQFTISVLSYPQFILPYLAVKYPGLFNGFGVPSWVSAGLSLTLVFCACEAIIPLFFFRLDMLLPSDHFLKKNWVRFSYYGYLYLSAILPWPATVIPSFIYDADYAKEQMFLEQKIYIKEFWDPDVFVIYVHDNFFYYVLLLGICFYVSVAALTIFGSIWKIHRILQEHKGISPSVKKHHEKVLTSLINMAITIGFIDCVFAPYAAASVALRWLRSDLINLGYVLSCICFPLVIIVYIATYSPYREFVISLIHGESVKECGKTMKIPGLAARASEIHGYWSGVSGLQDERFCFQQIQEVEDSHLKLYELWEHKANFQ